MPLICIRTHKDPCIISNLVRVSLLVRKLPFFYTYSEKIKNKNIFNGNIQNGKKAKRTIFISVFFILK